MAQVSDKGADFVEDKELWVTRAYKDPGGVVTVGPGLTMLSTRFSAWWRARHGRSLRVGDSLPRAEGMPIFREVLDHEYLPPVVKAWGSGRAQHVYDGGSSVSYNVGGRALTWKWAQAIARGDIAGGCKLLLTTAVTAAGRPLAGLRTRRKAEARLIEFADYGSTRNVPVTEGGANTPSAISSSKEEVMEYQRQLVTLGYYKGNIDGKAGDLTKGAVKNFQRATPGLRVDGKVGPATRSALARAVAAKNQGTVVLGGGTVTGGGSLGLGADPWVLVGVAAGVIVLLVVVFFVWNNRGVIFRRRTAS